MAIWRPEPCGVHPPEPWLAENAGAPDVLVPPDDLFKVIWPD